MGGGMSSSSLNFTKTTKGNFHFHSIIGKGKFGMIYSALHIQTQEKVAIKEMSLNKVMETRSGVAMLFSELSALRIIKGSPFTIGLKGSFRDTINCYFIMDIASSGSLKYHMIKGCHFTEKTVSLIIGCISIALHHIHSCGVVHRNVTPHNILFNECGYPYLTDFSLSHLCDDATDYLECTLTTGTQA